MVKIAMLIKCVQIEHIFLIVFIIVYDIFIDISLKMIYYIIRKHDKKSRLGATNTKTGQGTDKIPLSSVPLFYHI